MRVRIDYLGGKRFKANSRQHSFYVDLPAMKGGSDSAPNPVEYFLSALGTCMSIYGLKYCQDEGIPAESMHLELRAEFDENATKITKIECTASSLSVPLGDKKSAFIDAINHCLIKNTLDNEPEIVVKVEEPVEKEKPSEGQSKAEENVEEESTSESSQEETSPESNKSSSGSS